MSKITLHNDSDQAATYVSNDFIDNYMTTANGEYVKIYLYLLRCMNSTDCSFSLSTAADKFEHTEKDIQRALKYWEKMKLLRLEYDTEKTLSGIHFLDSKAPGKAQEASSESQTASAGTQTASAGTQTVSAGTQTAPAGAQAASAGTQKVSAEAQPIPTGVQTASAGTQAAPAEITQRSYSAAEMAAFQEKEDVRELLFVTEHYLKRPLTSTDINTILFWYDELKFPVDLIEYLIEYCLGKGHISLNYMNKVALAWKKENVNTVERAKCVSSSFSQLHFTVMKALGITGRNLVPAETACIDKWSKTYGFTPDIIQEACRRTIAATHQPSIGYADSILKNWHEQNVHHLSDIVKLDSNYQNEKKSARIANKAAAPNRFHNFNQRNYDDMDRLEQQLLNSSHN